MNTGFDFLFNIFPILFFLVFFLVFGVIIVSLVRSARQWRRNNQSPVLTVDALVADKRMQVHHHAHTMNGPETAPMTHTTSSTSYFVTFQVESGDRMELPVPDQDYGMMIQGDHGKLTFQGTRFLGFQRAREQ